MIRGAVFDVDGTLLDSMPVWRDAGARYLKSLGITPEPGLGETLFPMSFEEGAAYLKRQYCLEQAALEIQAGISNIIGGFYRDEAALKPGVVAFLERLRQKGVPMVLATTGDPLLIQAALERQGVAEYFSRTFTCAELDTSKQKPDIYFAAADFLGCRPEETAVFEDVLHAVRTAAAAGFLVAAVEDAESAADRAEIRSRAHWYMKDFTHFDDFWSFAARN